MFIVHGLPTRVCFWKRYLIHRNNLRCTTQFCKKNICENNCMLYPLASCCLEGLSTMLHMLGNILPSKELGLLGRPFCFIQTEKPSHINNKVSVHYHFQNLSSYPSLPPTTLALNTSRMTGKSGLSFTAVNWISEIEPSV